MKILNTVLNHSLLKSFSEPPVTITQNVLDQIVATIASRPPESGGLFGGDRPKQKISRFFFDANANVTHSAYSLEQKTFEKVSEAWDDENGDKVIGVIHSHPDGCISPTGSDEKYAAVMLNSLPDMERLFLPIVVFENGRHAGKCECVIRPYVAYRNCEGDHAVIRRVLLNIEDETGKITDQVETYRVRVPSPYAKVQDAYSDDTFVRVRTAYDMDLMRQSRVVIAGVGGASEFIESLARAGVGEFVLIDPDVVALTNLATQQTYRRDLGKDKVKVLAERIRDINPSANVLPLRNRLESLDDTRMEQLLKESFPFGREAPRRTLLCGCTDSFPAQSRVNRLAINFAVPSLCAQMYLEGRGAEVTFTHPDLTPACHRCALASRYHAYESGTVERVGSEGSNVFATVRVNATCGFIALALLHAEGNHPRWGGLMRRVGSRNLLMIRMDPDFSRALGIDVFERTFGDVNGRVCFDETIWTTVTPDDGLNGAVLCPDCCGTGHLRSMAGRFADTLTGRLKEQPAAVTPPPLPPDACVESVCVGDACSVSA
ncbi:MAG: ThiF family adenylyltransferase [Kiritimatiellae bacterium]|jgi:proteasome lid subunit RPN8/RPN11|nr:ThiF family adenylyltransferase [Kiritimatiellia bacterium]